MSRLRILYVDDSATQRDMFTHSLSDGEYDVLTVADTVTAERVMKGGGFDLVVIDYHLGDEERGDACLRQLRPMASEQARFFLYTTDHDAFRRHREMGFDGVLMLKGKSPIRPQIDVIAKALRRTTAASA